MRLVGFDVEEVAGSIPAAPTKQKPQVSVLLILNPWVLCDALGPRWAASTMLRDRPDVFGRQGRLEPGGCGPVSSARRPR
jgi:hypothetical protein